MRPEAAAGAALLVALVACNERSGASDPTLVPLVSPAPAAASSPCPPEMVLVRAESGGVCIDRFEAALEGRRFSEPVDGVDGGSLIAVPARGMKPQVNINEPEAEAACGGASKRLCTGKEWKAACRGPSDFVYPYGNEHVEGACNEGKPRPSGATKENLDDPSLAESPNGIEPGGAHPRCVSPSGIYDLHGNVHEWVSDGSNPADPRFGMFLGGYFADGSENGPGCTYKTTAHLKTYHDYSTGFRCCKDPSAAGHASSSSP